MCDSCGCADSHDPVTITKPHAHPHPHSGDHGHDHSHPHGQGREITLSRNLLSKNNLIAERNRGYFEAKDIFVLNLLSSPGSGKTTLLERTILELKGALKLAVIEGDQQTLNDAERIDATGVPVIQVNTGTGCHLDADMIHRASRELDLSQGSVLFIENVGNLVCPALFDLGEAMKVVVISVAEGDDKPQKYPTMFHAAQVCIINKIDLLPHVDFSMEKCREYAMAVNHHLEFFEVSAKTGEGIDAWKEWLIKQARRPGARPDSENHR